jgi:uncharacterized protein DUF4145
MNNPPLLTSNFAHLQDHDAQLLRLGMLAERYFPNDPNTSLLKLRQLAELLAQLVATKVGLYQSAEESQYDLLRRLQDQGILPREIAQLFGAVRRAGNAASHGVAGDHRTALAALKITWQLGIWFTVPSVTLLSSPAPSSFRRPRRTKAPSCVPNSPATGSPSVATTSTSHDSKTRVTAAPTNCPSRPHSHRRQWTNSKGRWRICVGF